MTTSEALLEQLRAGERRLHDIGEDVSAATAADIRREFVAEETETAVSAIGEYEFDAEAANSNIENMIGAVQIPCGVAGPVLISGNYLDGKSYLPMATTEGALLASVNRGCSVISDAGGANVRVLKSGMARAPVFRVDDVAAVEALCEWVDSNEERLTSAAEGTTSHGEVLDITPYSVGRSVYLRFRYDTKDAMGMNMATIATEAACELIEAETTAELVALSGNLCTDKKPAAMNAIEGRGHSVTADITIPTAQLTERLHTTPAAFAEVNTRKNLVGSAKAGSLGFNAHVANVVAGIFLATGQDEAQVVESANAITTAEVRDNGLYLSVTLPSLEVGTVGGGTTLPMQSEALEMIGVKGGGDPPGTNAKGLAEAIAVGCLAGELSLIAALSSRHLSSAHTALGRE